MSTNLFDFAVKIEAFSRAYNRKLVEIAKRLLASPKFILMILLGITGASWIAWTNGHHTLLTLLGLYGCLGPVMVVVGIIYESHNS